MADYAFFSFVDETLTALGVEILPVPVRSQVREEVFGGEEVRVDLLLDELDHFLDAFPELGDMYSGTVEVLTWMAAVREGESGNTDAAACYLEIGLGAAPDSLLLRSNYAMVLQLQGKGEDALEQYEVVLSEPEGRENPMVRLMAARLYAEQEKYLEAYRLLDEMAHGLPADDAFWDFLAEMKELAGVGLEPGTIQGAEEALGPGLSCRACGQALRPGTKFCPRCGAKTESGHPGLVPCPACGNPLEEGLRFCNMCGKPVEGAHTGRSVCAACGNLLEEGLRYCNMCGKPV